ncbi:MAG: biotin--[acetyl-CoA-carboxylase] ligase [Lachnospiraceae bacterium]|nr:biotin--[acetyl-CoA-carboxylase] ligase [Lachnospiraceae bacterium]
MNRNEQLIMNALDQPDFIRLDLREEADSTNRIAKQMGQDGAPEGYLVIADRQTAGRGRLGRSFSSPKGTGLYMSLLLRPDMPASEAVRITAAAAVAAAEAVNALSGADAGVKWVNDLYLNGRKICGILTESVLGSNGDKPEYAVLGIGINLTEPEGGFDASIADKAGAIWKRGEMPDGFRERLAAEIVNRFLPYYRNLFGAELLKRYRELSVLPGKEVLVYRTFAEKEEGKPAKVLGIEEDFGLLVRFEDGTEEVLSTGEVSLKWKQ